LSVLVGINLLVAAGLAGAIALGARMTVWRLAGCALLLAGAVGNLIDRLRFDGLVIDFMNVGVGPLRSGIFNVADMAITAGALLLLLPAAVGARPTGHADARQT
jgi:signal peptidase II